MMRIKAFFFLAVLILSASGCASTPEERGPWHEWLHTHGLE